MLLFLLALLGPLGASTRSSPSPRRLTELGDISTFDWSPRGDSLYLSRPESVVPFASDRFQTVYSLSILSLAAGTVTRLSDRANQIAVSPDGSSVAFVALDPGGSSHLESLSLSTVVAKDLGAVEPGTEPQYDRSGRLFFVGQGMLKALDSGGLAQSISTVPMPDRFAVSPDGDRVAFVASARLHVARNARDEIVWSPVGDESINSELRWSHDGKSLVFLVTQDGVDPELWLWREDGGARPILRGRSELFSGIDWAPDSSSLIFTRTPTGSTVESASEIWQVAVGGAARRLTFNTAEESSPRYSPDGKQIAFLRSGDIWLMDTSAQGSIVPDSAAAFPAQSERFPAMPSGPVNPVSPVAQLAPPETIRVYHHSLNTCRNVPVGQVDTINFESYVKGVVAGEVYSSWQTEALKTQAVAARTYGWYYVQHPVNANYDVTDMMQHYCDQRYATTNAAVDATRGQYGAYGGKVIVAFYSANNADPTGDLSDTYPYITSVDDPVTFGDARNGHGWGMSQWGAQRWASPPYNWNYQQILAHYYTGITIESAAGALPDAVAPIGSTFAPWSNWGYVSNRLYLLANASDDASGVSAVAFDARYFDGSAYQNSTLPGARDGLFWSVLADLSSLPDQSGITITPRVTDGAGHTYTGNGLNLLLDRALPVGSVTGPSSTSDQTVTLSLNASDLGPGGLKSMAFSNNWIWEGEKQSVTNNSGQVVDDAAALNGKALRGEPGTNAAGYWYGPYTALLPAGRSYRAYFRLRTDQPASASESARLDVVDNGGQSLLGIKRLRGTDFASTGYQEFYVDFDLTAPASGLEFRVGYEATASLWLDRIIVVSYPVAYSTTANWTLSAGEGQKVLQAKFIDGAGNISADAVFSTWLGKPATATPTATRVPTDTPTPTPTPVLTPQIYLPIILK